MKRRNYLQQLGAVGTGTASMTALSGCSRDGSEKPPGQDSNGSVDGTGSGNGTSRGDGSSPGQDNPSGDNVTEDNTSGDKSTGSDTDYENYKSIGKEQTEPGGGPHPKSRLEFGDATYILQGGLTEDQKSQEDFKYSEIDCDTPVALELTDGDESVEGLLDGDSNWEDTLTLGPVKMEIMRKSCSDDPLEIVYQTEFYIAESEMPSESVDSQMDIGSQLEAGYADPDSIYEASL